MGTWHRRPAYTLLELLTVLVIIAILASIAIPRFGSAAVRQRADAAARRVIADLALARRRAKLSSASQTIVFNVAANSYQLLGMSDPDHPSQPYEVRLDDDPYHATIVSADFGGDAKLIFDGYGVPDSGGVAVIAVGAEQRTVKLDVDLAEAQLQ